jgi:hypothetical protein
VEVAKAWIICCYSWLGSLAVSRDLDLYILSISGLGNESSHWLGFLDVRS